MVSQSMGWMDSGLTHGLLKEQGERSVRFCKSGKDKRSSGFQKGDEIKEEGYLQKFHPLHERE